MIDRADVPQCCSTALALLSEGIFDHIQVTANYLDPHTCNGIRGEETPIL